jgi:hypothetical protein
VRRFAIAVVVPALLAGACGGADLAGDEELTARPFPREAPAVDEDADEVEDDGDLVDASDTPEDGPEPDVAADTPADPESSRDAQAAAYVQQAVPADALDHDVLLVDRADGGQLLLALVAADGEAVVEAARWVDGVFEQADRVEAGPAEALGTLRTPTAANGDRVVALGLRFDGDLRIAVWDLHDDGLETPEACPIEERRDIRGQGAGEVTITCDSDDDEVLVWHDGAFVQASHAARTESPDDDEVDEVEEIDDDAEEVEEDERERARGDRAGPPGKRALGPAGRSDAADSPPGAQGRGHRGR